jgi:sensor histidine kinase YesM
MTAITPDRGTAIVKEMPDVRRNGRERWFAGMTWKGMTLVVLLCAFNAVRRQITGLPLAGQPFGPWLSVLIENFGTSLIVMLPTTAALVAAYNRIDPASRWRYPALAVAVLLASVAGVALLGLFESRGTVEFFYRESGSPALWIMGTWPRYATLALLIAAVFAYYRSAEASHAATQQAELERARFLQQTDEARLQVLQAQIEPHFLFNTLANVRRLYQTDPAPAESMLDNLMRYLAVALPQMRAADSTLGREAALTESYLEIQRIRMGRRLAFEIDVPERLREARIPPMMLLTLAENAVKHGLNPLPEGGSIRVAARDEAGRLVLEIADTGRGFTASSGGGTGLANTRARLVAMYGPAAQLGLAVNRPRGVTATIALPLAAALPGAAS